LIVTILLRCIVCRPPCQVKGFYSFYNSKSEMHLIPY